MDILQGGSCNGLIAMNGLRHFGLVLTILFPVLVWHPAKSSEAPVTALVFAGEPWAEHRNGQPGVIPRFFKRLSVQAGVPLKVRVLPYKRMLSVLATRDGVIAVFFRSRVGEEVAKPLVRLTNLHTVVLPGAGRWIRSYDDLNGLRIAVKNGVPYSPRFDGLTTFQRVATTSYIQSVKLLRVGRVDAVAGSWVSIAYAMAKTAHHVPDREGAFILLEREVWLQRARNFDQKKSGSLAKLVTAARHLADRNVYRQLIDDILEQYVEDGQ